MFDSPNICYLLPRLIPLEQRESGGSIYPGSLLVAPASLGGFISIIIVIFRLRATIFTCSEVLTWYYPACNCHTKCSWTWGSECSFKMGFSYECWVLGLCLFKCARFRCVWPEVRGQRGVVGWSCWPRTQGGLGRLGETQAGQQSPKLGGGLMWLPGTMCCNPGTRQIPHLCSVRRLNSTPSPSFPEVVGDSALLILGASWAPP